MIDDLIEVTIDIADGVFKGLIDGFKGGGSFIKRKIKRKRNR